MYSVKCPHAMKPIGICIHNTANDASAENEVRYMLGNNQKVSYHYAVDDKEIVHAIPNDRNAWHAGDGSNGAGNRRYISIEICYSKSGGTRFEAAMIKAAELTAQLLNTYGWDISHVKKHQDFSGKYCPHRILSDYGWDYFLNLVRAELGEAQNLTPVLRKGSTGEAVKRLQSRLNEWGYELEVDGSFGPATLETVKDFQEKNNLEVDGSVGPLTWGKLLEEIDVIKVDRSFKVKVDISDLCIRTGPGTTYTKTGKYTGRGVFTIIKAVPGSGSKNGWGELKSGAGWISLDYAKEV